jgi:short-subunit dehydrogenase
MNKTALITGAIKGIGFEVSKQLGELEVILIDTQTMIGKISSNKFSRH